MTPVRVPVQEGLFPAALAVESLDGSDLGLFVGAHGVVPFECEKIRSHCIGRWAAVARCDSMGLVDWDDERIPRSLSGPSLRMPACGAFWSPSW